MARLAALAALCLIISLILASPALAEAPLENPETAQPAYSGIALLSYYSGTLDFVIEKSSAELQVSLEKVPFANIPPSLDGATEQFSSSTTEAAYDVIYLSEGVDNLTTLYARYRLDEAVELADNLTAVVAEAMEELAQMEQAVEANGQVFQVNAAASDSGLRQAYDEVLDKIRRIRQEVALYEDIILGMLKPSPGTRTVITLSVDPGSAFVGEAVSFQGRLTSVQGNPLAGRQVQVLLDGQPSAAVVTGPEGFYQGSLQVPYWYVDQITVRALYQPAGADSGTYLASLSPDVMLQVLFYGATLTIDGPGWAHPGLRKYIVAAFDYGPWLIASERRVEIYLDNDLVASFMARPNVDRGIAIPADIWLGRHAITVSAQAMGRYAPVVATGEVRITRVPPVVELQAPPVAWVPWSVHVSGTARADLGPVDGVYVTTGLRGSETRTATAGDGAFETSVKMGWGLDLFGMSQVEVEVTPGQPWYGPVTVTRNIFVINVVNCSVLLAILAVLGVYVPRRLKGRVGIWPSVVKVRRRAAEPESAPVAAGTPSASVEPAPVEPSGSLRERILGWYLLLLAVVQRITRVSPRPNQTLREFMRETGPALGPLSRRFAEATITVEQLLYSRHEPSDQDVERTRTLSHNLEEGLGGEAK